MITGAQIRQLLARDCSLFGMSEFGMMGIGSSSLSRDDLSKLQDGKIHACPNTVLEKLREARMIRMLGSVSNAAVYVEYLCSRGSISNTILPAY